MIFEHPQALRQRIGEMTGREAPRRLHIFEDTSQFMSIDAGAVLRLAGNDYFVSGQAREGRFGIDEQPKFWVKSSIDLNTGARKIIKMVFRETFNSRIGATVFRCTRSAEKEAAVLERMQAHPNFMHGQAVRDAAGNLVRIIDFISGPSLFEHLRRHRMPHAAYYRQKLPRIMEPVIECLGAIAHLHKLGLHHGDIRADHLIIKNGTDTYVWIDFDYEVDNLSYDLFCAGNIVLQVVGKGRHSVHDIRLRPSDYPGFNDNLAAGDMSLMFPHRVCNLRKLYPHISAALNEVLMRFSVEATDPYSSLDSLQEDLRLLFPSGTP